MNLSEFDKEIIKLISKKQIVTPCDFALKYFKYKEGINNDSNFFHMYYSFHKGKKIYILEDHEKAFYDLQRFLALISYLNDLKLIYISKTKAITIPPFFFSNTKGRSNPKPDEAILSILKNYLNDTIIPLEKLDLFINRGFITETEFQQYEQLRAEKKDRLEEKELREKTQKETRRLAYFTIGVSMFTAITTTLFNYYTYTNERIVVVKNMRDTSYVKLINPQVDSTTVENIQLESFNNTKDE